MNDILDDLIDLREQAVNENSHNYVKSVVERAMTEIAILRTRCINQGAPVRLHTPVKIEHDDFEGDIIGAYITKEGKRGFVLQQHGTRVVHVYGEKFCQNEEVASKCSKCGRDPTKPEPCPVSDPNCPYIYS